MQKGVPHQNKRLRGAIYGKGYNISSFAEKVGISNATMGAIVNKGAPTSMETMRKIQEALDLSAAEVGEMFLLDEEEIAP